MRFAFENITLDTDRRELRRHTTAVAVEPQVFDLIVFLIDNRHKVVSRDDMLEGVWHGRIVSESTLATRINAARRALGDSGSAQRLIRTVHRRGFHFVGDIVEKPMGRHGRSLPGATAIAVLPFRNLSGYPRLDWLAAGITEDLRDALGKAPALSTPAGDFEWTGQGLRRAAEGLPGIRYVLAGSVQGSERRVRVIARLVDTAAGGSCLWSDRFDFPAQDMLAQQDDIVRKMLIEISAKLVSGDHAHIEGERTRSLEALLLHGQGFQEWCKFERAANVRARQLFQRSHEADPKWPTALAHLASTYREAAIRRWDGSPDSNLALATEIGERAVAVGPDHVTAVSQLAHVLVNAGRVDEGLKLAERAIEIGPSDFFALGCFAYNLARAGEVARAHGYFARSRKACPVPFGPMLANEAFVLHLAGQREQAIGVLKECADCSDIVDTHVRLAAAYFEGGRVEEAREEIAEVFARQPDATIGEYTGNLPFPSHQRLAWYQDLLRGAGLPDRF